tara:strand:+ start:4120 stop:4629 length:510 start_codon:yes stop_codon:yes gene_type:complete
MDSSVILVGMPGAGKSTIGLLLAKELAKDFVDTDLLIQLREGATLQDILDKSGYLTLRAIEEAVLLAAQYDNHIIATGGSAVYSDEGMQHLCSLGPVVFLDVGLTELRARIHNYDQRGIARRHDQSFENLFVERRVLYQRYADITIECYDKDQNSLLQLLLARLPGAAN